MHHSDFASTDVKERLGLLDIIFDSIVVSRLIECQVVVRKPLIVKYIYIKHNILSL